MTVHLTQQKDNRRKELEILDRRFNVIFSFPGVFTSLHDMSESEIPEELTGELILLLATVLNQFVEEDQRSANREGFTNFASMPLFRDWRNLRKEDMCYVDDDMNIGVKDTCQNFGGRMMWEFGPIKFAVLNAVSMGPYGPQDRNRYHLALQKMVDYMSYDIYHKVPAPPPQHRLYVPKESYGINDGGKVISAVMSALFSGVL